MSACSTAVERAVSPPGGERHAAARARRGAIERNVLLPLHAQPGRGPRGDDPVADLRAAGIELGRGKRGERRVVAVAAGVEDRAVERLVDGEMAQAARREDA